MAVILIYLIGSARSVKINYTDPIKPLDCHIGDIFGAEDCISNQITFDLIDFRPGRAGNILCYCR